MNLMTGVHLRLKPRSAMLIHSQVYIFLFFYFMSEPTFTERVLLFMAALIFISMALFPAILVILITLISKTLTD